MNDPKKLMDIKMLKARYHSEHLENIVQIHKNRLELALKWIDKGMTHQSILDVQKLISGSIGIVISERLLVPIIYYSPFLPFEINEFGADDTACADELYDTLANFFLKRNWPTNADKENIEEFENELKFKINEFLATQQKYWDAFGLSEMN